MAEVSQISWTDATFNPWIGCTKISPACDHCYAARDNKLRKWVPEWGEVGKPATLRKRTKTWGEPLKWNRKAAQTGLRASQKSRGEHDPHLNRSIAAGWGRLRDVTIRVTPGDCRTDLQQHGPFDMLLADPPYGDTSLDWDKRCEGWLDTAVSLLKPNGSIWIFGSMRFFQDMGLSLKMVGLRFAQDIVWEKHNGSGFHADRFKRVHEHACQYYLASAPWASVYNDVQTTPDAIARSVKRKKGRPAHMGMIEQAAYHSEDGGPLIMRSVIYMRSMHGRAIHPTEKPAGLLEILVRTSCPPGGIVGDLFAGSGAAGEAAMHAGRRYAGCEIDHDMAQKANDRLAAMLPFASQVQPS